MRAVPVALVLVAAVAGSLATPTATIRATPTAQVTVDSADEPARPGDPGNTDTDNGTGADADPDADDARPEDELVELSDNGLVPAQVVDVEIGDQLLVPEVSFGSAELGVGDTITLDRPAGRREIDLAIPDGLVFTGLETTVVVPRAVHEIQLDIAVGGRSIFSAAVPGGVSEELSLFLDPPVAEDTTLAISVQERYGVNCTPAAVEPSAVRLTGNEFRFERFGRYPETVADFFPPVLQHAIVVLDPDGASSLRSAAFELATALARRYAVMPTVDVVHRETAASSRVLPPPVSSDPLTRTIVLVEADEAEMRVVQGSSGSHLTIAGPPGLIEEMAAAVSERELSFIARDSVRVEELAPIRPPSDLLGQRSLRDVGVRRLEVSGGRMLELPISLPQSVFGQPVDEIKVRIGGIALASSTQGQDPVVTLWLNGDLLDAIDYDDSGRFDVEFVLDRSQIERDNVIVVRSELPLDCGDELPNHELALDAGSWVDADPGQSLPPSLDRFPQVAVGHLAVAAGPSDSETELAMATLGMLQASSPLPIRPQTAAIERVLAGFSPGLVVTNGKGPLADAVAGDLTTVRSEQLAFVSGDSPEDLAFLSATVTDNSQDVLVVFSPSRRLNRTLVDLAAAQGWSAFGGGAVGVRGDGDIVRTGGPNSATQPTALSTLAPPPEEPVSVVRLFGLGALGAVALVIGVFMIRFVLGALRQLR